MINLNDFIFQFLPFIISLSESSLIWILPIFLCLYKLKDFNNLIILFLIPFGPIIVYFFFNFFFSGLLIIKEINGGNSDEWSVCMWEMKILSKSYKFVFSFRRL